MKKGLVFFVLGFLLLFSFNVHAAGWSSFIDYNLGDIYNQYYSWFDFIILFFLFASLTQVAFSKRFPGTAGDLLTLALGFGLAFGAISWESYSGRSIFASLFDISRWPAVALLLALVWLAIFKVLHHGVFGKHVKGWKAFIVSGLFTLILFYIVRNANGVDFPEQITQIGFVLLGVFIVCALLGLLLRSTFSKKSSSDVNLKLKGGKLEENNQPIPSSPNNQTIVKYRKPARTEMELNQKYQYYLFSIYRKGGSNHSRRRSLQAMYGIWNLARQNRFRIRGKDPRTVEANLRSRGLI